MHKPFFKRISYGDIRGYLREDIALLLPPTFFEDPISFVRKRGGDVIKESKLRWAAVFTLPDGKRIFFKRDKTKGWLESLKFLFLQSKARKEWSIAYQLKEKDLNVPQPLGWMERVHRGFVKESYYLSEAIGSGASIIEDSAQRGDRSLIDELAQTVRKIHDLGLFHQDLHGGNFLWNGTSLFLTDLHRAKILRSLTFEKRLWNLSQLFHSMRSIWGREDQRRFIERYLEASLLGLQGKEEVFQEIFSMMDRLQKRQWKSRTKRCLKESTEFSVEKEKGTRYYHRRDFPLNRLEKAVERHLFLVREEPSALAKYSSGVIVSVLNDGEGRVCVKQFRYPSFRDRFREHFRRSKGRKAWVAGNGLMVRGIPSLHLFALVEKRGWLGLRESFFLMEASETGQDLDRYLFRGFKDLKEKRFFIKNFAQWLSHFHKMGLYHKDMKTCNILVSENGATWNFHLLDLEDVRLNERIDERRLLKNLLQLNTSTPRIMTRMDRLGFFREYIRLNPMIKNQKGFLRQLIEESRRRGLVYVSPRGVVMETM
jgi:tRNA A-37 threonylcarbamoyl transferase component Bud32